MYLDYLRVLLAFWVVLTHSSFGYLQVIKNFGVTWKVAAVYNIVGQCTVPLFFMISGVLFLDKKKKIDIKSIYTRYIPPLAISFVVWSLGYAFLNGDHKKGLYTFVQSVIDGGYHMWFIPIMIGLYMLVPLFKKIVESKTLTKYYLVLFVIFSFVIPTLQFLSEAFPFPGSDAVSSLLSTASSSLSVNMVIGYGGFMVLGHFLHTASIKKKTAGFIYFWGVLGLLFTVAATFYLSVRDGELNSQFMDRRALGICLAPVAAFVFFKQRFGNKSCSDKLRKVVVALSDCTYGVYLSHVLVITAFRELIGFDSDFINPALGSPLFAFLVFAVCVAIVFILKRIPFVKKYIV